MDGSIQYEITIQEGFRQRGCYSRSRIAHHAKQNRSTGRSLSAHNYHTSYNVLHSAAQAEYVLVETKSMSYIRIMMAFRPYTLFSISFILA